MTEEEKYVRKELEKIYPQLLINAKKVCGAAYDKWGEDLLPVAITFFLEKPIQQQLKTIKAGKLENFITWIMNIQLKSNSSDHFSVYRKPMSASRELFEGTLDYEKAYDYKDDKFNEELYQCVINELDNIPQEFKEAIIGIVLKYEPLSNYYKKTNLGLRTFNTKIEKYIKQIRIKCEHCL